MTQLTVDSRQWTQCTEEEVWTKRRTMTQYRMGGCESSSSVKKMTDGMVLMGTRNKMEVGEGERGRASRENTEHN